MIKSKKGFTTLIQLFLVSILALVVALVAIFLKHDPFKVTPALISPVSSLKHQAIAENVWFPQSQVLGQENINLTAKAAFFVEVNSGQILFEKNSQQRLSIASLTKIMTAIIALEHKNLNDTLKVPEAATNMEPDKMYLKGGESLSLEELLDGLFLVSANDAAEVIAQQTTADRAEFIALMNEKAAQLGMKDTKFINPTGLEEEDPRADQSQAEVVKQQYSTAFDVALMSRFAIKRWPHLIEITSKPQIYLPASSNHQEYGLGTNIDLVQSYDGVKGFKTGYTDQAGLTIVTLAKKSNSEVLGVLLGATDLRGDDRTLLDYCFRKLGLK